MLSALNKPLSAYFNVLLQKLAYVAKTPSLGYPSVLYFEPVAGCNLACPACPTGLKTHGKSSKLTDFSYFSEALDMLGSNLFVLYFYNWGEPFLNKKVNFFIQLASDRSIYSSLSSNLSIPLSDERVKAVLDSGLGELKVGMDGFTQEVYSTYRVWGGG